MKRSHKRILFVCTGNTCRSPMAELLLKNKLKQNKIRWWDVASRGIQAEVNNPLSANSCLALQERGITVGNFTPKQLTQEAIEKSYLVVTMTQNQKQILSGCGNIMSVYDICGFDIPDPYGGDIEVYRKTCAALDMLCDTLIKNVILKITN